MSQHLLCSLAWSRLPSGPLLFTLPFSLLSSSFRNSPLPPVHFAPRSPIAYTLPQPLLVYSFIPVSFHTVFPSRISSCYISLSPFLISLLPLVLLRVLFLPPSPPAVIFVHHHCLLLCILVFLLPFIFIRDFNSCKVG